MASKLDQQLALETSQHESQPTRSCSRETSWLRTLKKTALWELRSQRGIALPLMAMNFTWFAKLAITTAFLGRLGELQLAGGALGFTFANVTGFSVLAGLCGAMEPICGQAFGAGNHKLLHKTLLMATILLLCASLPISFLWLNVDKILSHFGQHKDITTVAKSYVVFLLPDLAVNSFLCPLKAYLSSQGNTIPILLTSALALVFHVPVNILLSEAMGLKGVAIAVWVSDLIVTIPLVFYVLTVDKWKEGGWWNQQPSDWIILLKLSGPCCLTTCLEWWCYEILVLLAGHLPNPRQAVSVLAIVLNFDYLLYSLMLSLAISASTRVSNELGANQANAARTAGYTSLAASTIVGCIGASIMASIGGAWGSLYSHEGGVVKGVKKMMLLMALCEVVNFPLTVCGGIVRATARPWLAMYANLGGFYFLALPTAVVLAFKLKMGLGGLLLGFIAGATTSTILLISLALRISWVGEAAKAQRLASAKQERTSEGETPDNPATEKILTHISLV